MKMLCVVIGVVKQIKTTCVQFCNSIYIAYLFFKKSQHTHSR